MARTLRHCGYRSVAVHGWDTSTCTMVAQVKIHTKKLDSPVYGLYNLLHMVLNPHPTLGIVMATHWEL